MKQKTLFLTYDGLLDPLGQSQILPYIKVISKKYSIHIISFEKKFLFDKLFLDSILKNLNITHQYLYYTENFGKLGRLYDFFRFFFISFYVILKKKYSIVHCRGHIPAYLAGILKFFFRFNLIFDFRGLWVDERIDNSSFHQNNILYRIIYRLLKKFEKKTIMISDFIVVLTNKAVPILEKIINDKIINIKVIPTCADYNFFNPLIFKNDFRDLKKELKIDPDKKIICYCGSVGGVYLLEKMIIFFKKLKNYNNNYVFLIITNNQEEALKKVNQVHDNNIRNSIIVKKINRNLVPLYLSIVDLMIIFINNTFARQASSPTKLAEAFAMGIPVIVNKGVGDMDEIIKNFSAGQSIELTSNNNIQNTIENIEKLKILGGLELRNKTRDNFGLEYAEKNYLNIYKFLQQKRV